MAKPTTKTKTTKQRSKPEPPSFDDILEQLRVYENGSPAPCMAPLFNSAGTRRVGWWWLSEDIASGWDDDEGPLYWTTLQLVLPGQGVIICGYSFTYADLDNPLTTYFIWNVFWRQTNQKARRKPAIDGGSRRLRTYTFDRIDNLVYDWGRSKPWFLFDFSACDRPSVTFKSGWLKSFLIRATKPARTKPKDRKLFRRLLEAIFALDPTGLLGAIRALIKEHPDFEEPIRLMIPKAFHAAAIDSKRLETADELAKDFTLNGRKCSARTILRLARKLKRKPRIGKHGRYSFDPQDAGKIFEEHNAERARTRNPD